MALALYRKYRPRTFAEVIGQDHVTAPLIQALRNDRLHHAYLFSGPRGCGKTSSARILARSLNCEKGPTPEPCGACDSCVALAPDGSGSIDVIEIDAASHGGVDDARELREKAFFAPVSSRFKVYVIDEAHMVSSAGFNALLKLVEEPPDYVMFVFATTEPEKVLGTIRSRTHHYPFRLIPPGVLRPYLEQMCQTEGVAVEPTVFPLVVRAGGGSARDALSILDQLIAGADEKGVTYAHAVALLGVTDAALIDEACDALAAADGAAVFATVDRVADAGHDPRRFAADLLERLRDLIVLHQVPDAAAKGLLDVPADQLERMTGQALRLGPATLSRLADIAYEGLTAMRGTTNPRLVLELICARMLLPGADDSTGALLQRLERMERRLDLSAAAPLPTPDAAAGVVTPAQPAAPVPAPPTAPPPTPAPAAQPNPTPPASPAPPAAPATEEQAPPAEEKAPATSPEAPDAWPEPAARTPAESPPEPPTAPTPSAAAPGALDAAAVRRVWDEIVTGVRRRSQRVAAVVREATVRAVEGDTLVLTFKHSFHASALTNSPEVFLDAVTDVLGGHWQVRCEVSGGGGSTATRGAAIMTPPRPAPARRPPAPRTGESSRTPAPAAPKDAGTDWPTPAKPGGNAPEPPPPAPSPPAQAAAPRRRVEKKAQDESWPDEPPYDPEYDPPPAGGALYEGFDPGDEPMDDAAGPDGTRQSSEEQAIALLKETLGAEKIGDAG